MTALCSKLAAALEAAGIRARVAYPAVLAPRLAAPMTAVRVARVEAEAPGFGGYLGQEETAGGVPRHGRLASVTAVFQVASPTADGGEACFREAGRVTDLLLAGIEGVGVGAFTVGPCAYDPETDQFICVIEAELRACLLADAAAEPEEELSGVVVRGAL